MNRRKWIQLLAVSLLVPVRTAKGSPMKPITDVAIIGGGPAGLTAALALARTGRTVTIFDDNNGRNFPAAHMMNFPSRDGTPPIEFRNQIKKDLVKYSEVSFNNIRVETLKKTGSHFLINGELRFRRILLAHGIRDILPEIPGIREEWGKKVFHCPFCHGHEVKGKKIGILAFNEQMIELITPMILGLTNEVTIYLNGQNLEVPEHLQKYVTINTEKITSVKSLSVDALLVRPGMALTTDLGTKLGCELTELGHYKVNGENMTTVEGVYAAGDIIEPMQSVVNSCASGQKSGAMISFSIVREDFRS